MLKLLKPPMVWAALVSYPDVIGQHDNLKIGVVVFEPGGWKRGNSLDRTIARHAGASTPSTEPRRWLG